jgi:CHAT domain-containing protein/Tfp pilus assembly protein PilF
MQVPVEKSKLYSAINHDFLYGNLDTAQKKAEKARAECAGKDPEWEMKFRLLEADVLAYQGLRSNVVSLLKCSDTALSWNGDPAIKRDMLCALAHARMGQPQESDREMREARQLSDLTNSELKGELLQAEAKLELNTNNLTQSAMFYRRSLEFARSHGNTFLEAGDLLNLGMVSLNLQRYDEALFFFKSSADLSRQISARLIIEAALGDAGVAYFNLGDFEKALSDFLMAEEEAEQIGTTSAQIDWLWDIGSSYYQLGDIDKSAFYYRRALELAHAIDEPGEIAEISINLGFLLYDEKRYDAARTLGNEALLEARKAGDESAQAEALFLQAMLATQQPDGKLGEQLLLQVLDKSSAIPSQQSAIENELANFYNRRNQWKQADLWYRKSIATFEKDRAAVRDEELRLPFFANGEQLYRQYADFLIDRRQPEQALRLLDQGRARTLSEGLGQSAVPDKAGLMEQSVARRLNATILFYALGPDKSYLWAIDSRRTRLFVLPKASDLEARVAAYNREILRSGDPLRAQDENGRYLYKTLVEPVTAMAARGSKVVIVGDGGLNSLNFDTLLVPSADGWHYWIDDVTISNANSIRLLAASKSEKKGDRKKNSLLLIGDPLPESKEFEKLPNAPVEITDVERHFQPEDRTLLTQAEAIPSAYAAHHPERFSYIHFVTHGTASRLSPLDSAVVLSASPGQPDTYKLYARDIVHHPLHAKLVTVSACNGSGVRAYAGEGLVGLSWAFLRAGSHNVIGALWEVNDASTPLLMDRLYSEINVGKSPEAALREAKLSLIHSTGIYRKPLYWAAFQLYTGS